jgi:hypothetical protein
MTDQLPRPRRKSAKHRALSAERKVALETGTLPQWYAAREAERAPPAPPPAPLEREAWDRAYGERPLTLDAAYWDDRGYMVWKAPTNQRGSRLAFSRNFANPTND